MINYLNHKVLITTDRWFMAPDGLEYRAVYGTLKAIHEAGKSLGFIPNRSHANWFIEVGNMIIMGCQVMYIMRLETPPDTGVVKDWIADSTTGGKQFERPTKIYISPE